MPANRFTRSCPSCDAKIPDGELFCQRDWFTLRDETRRKIRAAQDLYNEDKNPALLARLKAAIEGAKLELRVKRATPPPKLEVVR